MRYYNNLDPDEIREIQQSKKRDEEADQSYEEYLQQTINSLYYVRL